MLENNLYNNLLKEVRQMLKKEGYSNRTGLHTFINTDIEIDNGKDVIYIDINRDLDLKYKFVDYTVISCVKGGDCNYKAYNIDKETLLKTIKNLVSGNVKYYNF